jgi:hypothetical protein
MPIKQVWDVHSLVGPDRLTAREVHVTAAPDDAVDVPSGR